jgi:hypothetical protein
MAKPGTIDGYDDKVTQDCERVLVTLLRNLGPWKDSIFLIGGLTPRYLVEGRPPDVPEHAGTLDLDIVIDILILEDIEAYKSLEENLRKIGFDNAMNRSGQKQNWRWTITMDDGSSVILELLADWSARLEMSQWIRETLDKESLWDEARSTSLSR